MFTKTWPHRKLHFVKQSLLSQQKNTIRKNNNNKTNRKPNPRSCKEKLEAGRLELNERLADTREDNAFLQIIPEASSRGQLLATYPYWFIHRLHIFSSCRRH